MHMDQLLSQKTRGRY
uniref:Uncharacterized protein n=1 Tax=Rhizophora mucronata TaxID=61149 RepID=A0A2P2MZ22_RHIMU